MEIPNFIELLVDLYGGSIVEDNRYKNGYITTIKFPKTKSTNGFVYLMQSGNFAGIKIGFSKNPPKREKTLQAELPSIKLLSIFNGTATDEKNLHQIFKNKRIRGEWFDLSEKDIKHITNYFNKNE